MARAFLRCLMVLTAVALLAPRAAALDPSRTLSQSVHRIWQVQQGLPQASIYAIVQSRDGYLWLGTQTGLVRFDGVRFTTIDEIDGVSIAGLWVTQLVEDDQGTLWIGTSHAGLIKFQHGAATRYGEPDGLPSDAIQCLFADQHATVWMCTPKGLVERMHAQFRVFGLAQGLTSLNIRAACIARDGALMVGTDDGNIATWDGARFQPRPLGLRDPGSIQAMLCAADTVWIGTNEGLFRLRGERRDQLTVADGLADNSVVTLTESRDGAIFVGTKNGFSRLRGTEIESFRPQDGLSQSTVYSVHEDREGSVWVATKHGLNQFLDGRAIPYTTSEGLPSNNTGPVLQDRRGTIWVGTLGAGLARFDGHHFVAVTTRHGLTSDTIRALAEDGAGDLWVGTDRGLNRLRRGEVTGRWTMRDGLPSDTVNALFRDHTGALWIATTAGPAVFRNGRLERATDPRQDTAEPITVFGEDLKRGVFAAPDSSGLLRHADALYQDNGGRLWVGTLGDGLRLLDGDRIFTFSVTDGLFDDVIYGIAADDQGRLWMACSKGIFSVDAADLRQFAAGKIASVVSSPYSPLDALRTIESQAGVQPVVSRMQDGRLWFATIRGVLVIDPDRSERHYDPPAVAIEEVTVDGERRDSIEIGTLPAGHNNVAFAYTGVSFLAPTRITFRHKLDGFDKTWIDAGARRQAFYTNLPPGSFRFRVVACNPDEACNEAANAVAFVIEPRYYQRAWFFPMCAAAIALSGWGLYRLRVRRLKEQFDLILAERGRIARELHDTLIQGFAGITMAMQALTSRLPSSSERTALEEIVGDAGTSLREARRSLAGLRRHDSHSGLAASLAQAAHQLTEAQDLRLKLNLDADPRDLPPDVEYNLVRITQEAVLNAVKHSGARTLQVSLDRTPDRLTLTVADDGSGFDAREAAPLGHYGLIGMKERAAQIGADFLLTTERGHGTTVSVNLQSAWNH